MISNQNYEGSALQHQRKSNRHNVLDTPNGSNYMNANYENRMVPYINDASSSKLGSVANQDMDQAY